MVLAAAVVVDKRDEVIMLCAVEDSGDIKGLVFKLVDAADGGSASKSHASHRTDPRRELELTRRRPKRRGRRKRRICLS